MGIRPVEFERVWEHDSRCPIYKITPDDGSYIHRFFDTSPWSPSGRYLTVLKLPFQDREPLHGEEAEVCVIDLRERTIETISATGAWCLQMGAQQQWGPDDRFLYFNDLHDCKPVCVKYDLEERRAFHTRGPLYQVSPDGAFAVGPDLYEAHMSQGGYGVTPPPARRLRFKAGTGGRVLWRTDLATGECDTLVSYEELRRHLPMTREFRRSAFIGFHVKFNPTTDRILFVMRAMSTRPRHGRFKRRRNVMTFKTDGTDITLALPDSEWSKGGHHPSWHPDGRRCLMNLKLDGENMRFVTFNYDGTGLRVLIDDVPGSGHPSYSPDGRYIITDSYVGDENAPDRDGAVPLRLIRVATGSCLEIAWVPVRSSGRGVLRCDPHPAWDASGGQVCFNGAPNTLRQVFIADVRELIDKEATLSRRRVAD